MKTLYNHWEYIIVHTFSRTPASEVKKVSEKSIIKCHLYVYK